MVKYVHLLHFCGFPDKHHNNPESLIYRIKGVFPVMEKYCPATARHTQEQYSKHVMRREVVDEVLYDT